MWPSRQCYLGTGLWTIYTQESSRVVSKRACALTGTFRKRACALTADPQLKLPCLQGSLDHIGGFRLLLGASGPEFSDKPLLNNSQEGLNNTVTMFFKWDWRTWKVGSVAVIVDDPGSIPTTHMVAHNIYNSSIRGSKALIFLLRPPGMHAEHRLQCMQHIHTQKIVNFYLVFFKWGWRQLDNCPIQTRI